MRVFSLIHQSPVFKRSFYIINIFNRLNDCVVDVSSKNIYDIPSIFNDTSQQHMQNVIVSDYNLVPIIDTARLFEKIGVLEETEQLKSEKTTKV